MGAIMGSFKGFVRVSVMGSPMGSGMGSVMGSRMGSVMGSVRGCVTKVFICGMFVCVKFLNRVYSGNSPITPFETMEMFKEL
jgi:hypothetical protein